MEKHLHYYTSHSQFSEPTNKPAVSYCALEDEVHYHPDSKKQITLYYVNLDGTSYVIDPEDKNQSQGHIPYYNVYSVCNLAASTNYESMVLTKSNNNLSVYPFNSMVVNNVQFMSTCINSPCNTFENVGNYLGSEHIITIDNTEFTRLSNQTYFNNDNVIINWEEKIIQ